MYLIKKYAIAFIVVFLIAGHEGGFYQSNIIRINDITISKPFGYHFSYIPTDENISKYELLQAYLGIKNSFTVDEEDMLFLKFEYIFFNKTIGLIIGEEKNLDLYESEIYKKEPIYPLKTDSCIYSISDVNEVPIVLMGINKQKAIYF